MNRTETKEYVHNHLPKEQSLTTKEKNQSRHANTSSHKQFVCSKPNYKLFVCYLNVFHSLSGGNFYLSQMILDVMELIYEIKLQLLIE